MRIVVQRADSAEVSVDGETVGKIGKGILVLCGFADDDDDKKIEWLAGRVAKLRIFPDKNGKLNLSCADIGGSALVISNFTLYGDCLHGTRPDFGRAASGEASEPMYNKFVSALSARLPVQTGKFGRHMETRVDFNGPVTVIIEK